MDGTNHADRLVCQSNEGGCILRALTECYEYDESASALVAFDVLLDLANRSEHLQGELHDRITSATGLTKKPRQWLESAVASFHPLVTVVQDGHGKYLVRGLQALGTATAKPTQPMPLQPPLHASQEQPSKPPTPSPPSTPSTRSLSPPQLAFCTSCDPQLAALQAEVALLRRENEMLRAREATRTRALDCADAGEPSDVNEQNQPEEASRSTACKSARKRGCGTPGCTLLDFHDGPCSNAMPSGKRQASMPLYTVVGSHSVARPQIGPKHQVDAASIPPEPELLMGLPPYRLRALVDGELAFLEEADRKRCVVASRLQQGKYVDWTMVAPAEDQTAGLALYAMRTFRKEREAPGQLNHVAADSVGTLDGIRLVSVDDPDSSVARELGTRFAEQGERHLAWVKQSGSRWTLVNAESAGAPFLQRINDPLTDRRPNVAFTERGVVKVIETVPPADLQGACSLADLRRSELLMRYERGYWQVHSA